MLFRSEEYSLEDMFNYGLTGKTYSRRLRDFLSDYFVIGHGNGKQFLKKLNAFDIKRIELEEKTREWLDVKKEIKPDIVLELPEDIEEIGPGNLEEDIQLKTAIEKLKK